MSNAVELRRIVKRFGSLTAVHETDMDFAEGSFITLLGPSGCGKTTTLRMIAGLEAPTSGDIMVKGKRINDLPIHRRNLGLVFQNYALFPHKTVFDNVAFGLKYRSVDRATAAERVRRALDLVRLPQMADRYPAQLSGGQQQRIALARAVVIEPDVLLLDEPLSALDANLRENMRIELKRIQRELGVTTIFVTHDQSEALAMSDRVVVMNQGFVEQVGPPQEVYNAPHSEFVAGFLGNSNILHGTVEGTDANGVSVALDAGGLPVRLAPGDDGPFAPGEPVRVIVRAERLHLQSREAAKALGDDVTVWPVTVEAVDYQGQAARYFLRAGELSLQAINPIERDPHAEGAALAVSLRPEDGVLLRPGPGGS